MTRFVLLALLMFSFGFAGVARAEDATGAPGGYAATVPVADTSDAQRDAALSAALAQVLTGIAPKVTPGADVLAQAPGLVRNYRYRRGAGGQGLELQVDFDPGSIRHLAQQLGAPVAAFDAGGVTGDASAQAAADAGGSGTLWVGGIEDSGDFAVLLAALRQSTQLHNVTPIAAKNDGVLLHLEYDAPFADITTALAAGGHLTAAPAHDGADASLRWVH
ncbi:MAG: DUF2066 domain-containing protein [Rhodanobacteraceae bacterium]